MYGRTWSIDYDLCGIDILRLQTLGTLSDHEADPTSFLKRAVAAGFDGREMDKDVFPVVARDKSVALGGVKPLHYSCFFHSLSSFPAMEAGGSRFSQNFHFWLPASGSVYTSRQPPFGRP